jgi:DNA-binding CsgD family transcriptional regulator
MFDYEKQKFISSNIHKYSVSGLSNELIKKEGADAYNYILSDSEKQWLFKMNEEAFKIFRKYRDLELATELELSYDLTGKNMYDREVTLHHRLVPYQFDDNGNLWLAFCIVSALPLTQKNTKACIECDKTGERYDFVNGKFVLSDYKPLTRIEIAILGYFADGLILKQISEKVGMSLRSVEHKKKALLEKLGAPTQAAAVYKAMNMGLI